MVTSFVFSFINLALEPMDNFLVEVFTKYLIKTCNGVILLLERISFPNFISSIR